MLLLMSSGFWSSFHITCLFVSVRDEILLPILLPVPPNHLCATLLRFIARREFRRMFQRLTEFVVPALLVADSLMTRASSTRVFACLQR